ncbi:hypothetical protein IJ103_00915 [Candidatus Saccharibacteria bacterium]|nr:hypothetical protein [Candidatus Saccharibacteria bacterium]MBQ9016793.1 hypothetical protein [Candidatus Saccharibacteria bacterium]
MIITNQTRVDQLKPIEDLSPLEQSILFEESEKAIREKNWSSLSDFTSYMERKYPRAQAV